MVYCRNVIANTPHKNDKKDNTNTNTTTSTTTTTNNNNMGVITRTILT